MAAIKMWIKHSAAVVLGMCLVIARSASAADDRLTFRLLDAARNQELEAVRALLEQGADPDGAHGDGSTALHWAAYRDAQQMVDLLIRAGSRVDAADDHGVTPLWLACANGAGAATIDRLLRAGADANAAHDSGETALMSASRAGNLAAVRLLLASGAQVNRAERVRGQTALMWAAAQGHTEIIGTLIEAGADLRARSHVRRQLVNSTGNADYTGVMEVAQGGFTPLLFAARNGHLDAAERLVATGADPNEAAADGTSALVIAAHSGQTAAGLFLLEAGADPNADGSGYTALHIAVRRGDSKLAAALLARGADPDARLVKPTPARRLSDDVALARPLVGATPVWLAAYFGEHAIVRLLTAAGADFMLTANDGATPLMAAIGRNAETAAATVKHLIELGAEVSAADENGNTALHRAASSGNDAVVELLAERGADLEARNQNGQTPLMLTRRRLTSQGAVERKTTAELLRKLGARN